MTQELSKLDARIESLERQNRRFKAVGLGLAAVLGTVGIMSASSAMCDTVSAERFVLHDAKGKTRMLMDAYHTSPHIAFRNEAGKTVATFGVDDKGESYLTLYDAKGNARSSAQPAKAEGCEKTKCEKKDSSIAMR